MKCMVLISESETGAILQSQQIFDEVLYSAASGGDSL